MTIGVATVERMRWWHVPAVMDLELELFGEESWTTRLFWSELAQGDTRHFLVAFERDELAGYAGLCAYPDAAYVQTLAVRPRSQGRGLGAALLRRLVAEAVRQGLDVVGLEVRADNARAQALYRRFGFEPVGIRKGYYQPSGTDGVVMLLTGAAARLSLLSGPS